MRIWDKIKQILSGNKQKALNPGQNHEQYINNKDGNYLERPETVDMDTYGRSLIVTSIKFERKITYQNERTGNIMIAKAYDLSEDDGTISYDSKQERNIVFEVEEGIPIDDTIVKKIAQYYMYEENMPNNNGNCIYIGKISSIPFDLGTNNKNVTVQQYVKNKIEPRIETEKRMQNEKQMKSFEERNDISVSQEYRNRIKRETQENMKYEKQVKFNRINNPYLTQVNKNKINGITYKDFDGVDIQSGEILRVRHLEKVGKDDEGTYLYTAYVDSTSDENNVEFLDEKEYLMKQPICFTTDKKVEDILNDNNIEELKNLLYLLSTPNSKNLKHTYELGELYYSGNFSNGKINYGENVSRTIKNKIKKISEEIYKQNENKDKTDRTL